MPNLIVHCGYQIDPVAGIVYGKRGRPIRKLNRGYVIVNSVGNGKNPFLKQAHRMVWEAVHGAIPDGLQINHKNGVKHDNRIENLELATPKENMRHANDTGLATVRGVSGHFGVRWENTKWLVSFSKDGRPVRYGRFDSLDEAKSVAKDVMRRLGITRPAERAAA